MTEPASKIGWFSATTIVAASMIGVGVFTTSGFALAALDSPGRVMAAWLVGSLIAICGAVSYSALASRFAESGGEYLFLARSLHPAAGLTAGVVSLLAGFTGPIAAAAIGLAGYASGLLPETWSQVPSHFIAISVIVLAGMMHTAHVGYAARVQDLVVVVKFVLILGFIAYALFSLSSWPGLSSGVLAPSPEVGQDFSVFEFARQLVWISFSFAGFNAAIYISGEVREPKRTVALAIIAGTCLVTLVYLMLNAIFVWAAPITTITADENISQVASTAAFAIGGRTLEVWVRWVIVVSLATSVAAMMMTGPRVYSKMAEDGFLPQPFAFRGRSPAIAIWFQAALAIFVVCVSTLQSLLSYLGLTLSLCSALTIASLYVLRYRGQIDRLPGWGIPPAIFIVATVSLGVLASWGDVWPAIAALGTLIIGAALYPLTKNRIPIG